MPEKEYISLHTLSADEKDIFRLSLEKTEIPENFIVTQKFKDVIIKLNSGVRHLNICGPKGVGKSLSLCAIAVLLKESEHHFLIYSPLCIGGSLYISYIEGLYKDFGK